MNSELINFYRTQSPYTDPGKYAYLFDDLPDAIPELQEISKGIRINYISDQRVLGFKAPQDRLIELESRTVEFMLSEIMKFDNQSLRVARPPEKRLIGTCRDSAILMCSILRHKNIPCRMRYGLAPSQLTFSNMILDHSICQYWDEDKNEWISIETEITQQHLDFHRNKQGIDLCNLRYPTFEYAGLAVRKMMAGDWDRYEFLDQGLWYYRNILLRDIAFLNKEETNLWDYWGIMLNEPKTESPETLQLLQEIAEWDQNSPEFIQFIRDLYNRQTQLQVPKTVVCKCPAHSEPKVIPTLRNLES